MDQTLDRLREMFGIEATDIDGVFEALEKYDRHMHRWVDRLSRKVSYQRDTIKELSAELARRAAVVETPVQGHRTRKAHSEIRSAVGHARR